MTPSIHRRPFSLSKLESALQFAADYTCYPFHSSSMVRRFLTQLSTGPHNVFDFFEGEQRVGLAVIVDKIQNPNGTACLEVLGFHYQCDANALFEVLFQCVSLNIPSSCTGLEM